MLCGVADEQLEWRFCLAGRCAVHGVQCRSIQQLEQWVGGVRSVPFWIADSRCEWVVRVDGKCRVRWLHCRAVQCRRIWIGGVRRVCRRQRDGRRQVCSCVAGRIGMRSVRVGSFPAGGWRRGCLCVLHGRLSDVEWHRIVCLAWSCRVRSLLCWTAQQRCQWVGGVLGLRSWE